MSREEIDRANNVLQTVEHQLAKAVASRDLAKLDLERTVIRAPADGWVTNPERLRRRIHHPRFDRGRFGETKIPST